MEDEIIADEPVDLVEVEPGAEDINAGPVAGYKLGEFAIDFGDGAAEAEPTEETPGVNLQEYEDIDAPDAKRKKIITATTDEEGGAESAVTGAFKDQWLDARDKGDSSDWAYGDEAA